MRKAPRTIKADLYYVDKVLREAHDPQGLQIEGQPMTIRLKIYKYRHLYKLVAFRKGKLIYRRERRK